MGGTDLSRLLFASTISRHGIENTGHKQVPAQVCRVLRSFRNIAKNV
jgi:hypothetical protein